jgi:hypothetical protein
MIKLLYKLFFELAEGLNTQSHYHINHNTFSTHQKLIPIKIETNRQAHINNHYHQKFHS